MVYWYRFIDKTKLLEDYSSMFGHNDQKNILEDISLALKIASEFDFTITFYAGRVFVSGCSVEVCVLYNEFTDNTADVVCTAITKALVII
jgi:hypothetical protein